MEINENVLQKGEKIQLALRSLYASRGYVPYRMSKFEEYDLYASNKEFLVSDNVLTFTDPGGKLMALKPDVTLSIIKNAKDDPESITRVYYNENVYRVAKGSDSFREIMQSGVECFGKVTAEETASVLLLAAEALAAVSDEFVLDVSNLTVLEEAIGRSGLSAEQKKTAFEAVGEKNVPLLASLGCTGLLSLLSIKGKVRDVLPALTGVCGEGEFIRVLRIVADSPLADRFRVDFSVTGDIHYYNGIVFKGFVSGIPTPVLSGGQYDNLMRRLGRSAGAIGFALYTDLLEREIPAEQAPEEKKMLNVALPKGRLGEKVYAAFAEAGYECPSILEQNRKLIFENPEKGVRYFWVKPSDVAIYVERGAADIGVAGKDILLEYKPDVYELLDLGFGKCRMCVAGPKNFRDDPSATLRVATKFPEIATAYYQSKGRDIDIIKLNGSIEIAPILGLSDVIVDIVETGSTLKENDLEVKETVVPISARLIANKSSHKFKEKQIETLTAQIRKALEEEK